MEHPTLNGGSSLVITTAPAFETLRSNDIALLSVVIVEQGDVGCAVGIVFDRGHFRWDVLFVSLEIDQAIKLFVSTTDMTGSDMAVMVTTAGTLFSNQKAFLRGYCLAAYTGKFCVTC